MLVNMKPVVAVPLPRDTSLQTYKYRFFCFSFCFCGCFLSEIIIRLSQLLVLWRSSYCYRSGGLIMLEKWQEKEVNLVAHTNLLELQTRLINFGILIGTL